MYSHEPKYKGNTNRATLNPIKETMYAVNRGSNGASNSSDRTKKGSAGIQNKNMMFRNTRTRTVQAKVNAINVLGKPVKRLSLDIEGQYMR